MDKFFKIHSLCPAFLAALTAMMTTACGFTETPAPDTDEPTPEPLKTVKVVTADQITDKLTRPAFFAADDSRFGNALIRRMTNSQTYLTPEAEAVIVDPESYELHENDLNTLAEIYANNGAIACINSAGYFAAVLDSFRLYYKTSDKYSADAQLFYDLDCAVETAAYYLNNYNSVSVRNIECLMAGRRSFACVTLPDDLDLVSDYELGRLADVIVNWLENCRSTTAAIWKPSVLSPRQNSCMSLMTYKFDNVIDDKSVVRSVPVNIAIDYATMAHTDNSGVLIDNLTLVSQNVWVGNSVLFCPEKQYEWTLAQSPAIAFGPYMREAEIKNDLKSVSENNLIKVIPQTCEGENDMEITASVDFESPAFFEAVKIESGDLTQSVSAVNQLAGFEIDCPLEGPGQFKWSYTNNTPLSVRIPLSGGSLTHPEAPMNMRSDINLTQIFSVYGRPSGFSLYCDFAQVLELQATPGFGWSSEKLDQNIKFGVWLGMPL